ncbi:MAG TPA: Xaa-Pro peptidase family protein [Baekduia sp.]|uniref:Xaa-Pro peptidase family protein n=1 Tax=Baekduia sp. TaxID=2600305 RepID=UPI002D7A1EF5|nr:Xaa-Pro peptidase family protein [Baekduia sp.]HET6507828.1 Xaa-Pro peptidase family protein [Baekduia sp.]
MNLERSTKQRAPFDAGRLDALLRARDVAALLATSPHNVRYLLGGYRFFLYDRLDPIGPSRYLPVVGYVPERLGDAFYVGAGNEAWGTDAQPLWVPSVEHRSWGTTDAALAAAEALRARGLERATIGVEPAYVPADAMAVLTRELPSASFVDVGPDLDELRAVKSAAELEILRGASRAVVEAMLATFAAVDVGMSTREVAERLRQEETLRGLTFAYCLVATGRSHARAPSDRRIEPGGVLSLDSGADRLGYTADLTRMGIAGEPSARHRELLAEVDAVQQAARAAVIAGRRGGDLFDAVGEVIGELPDGPRMSFLAHGTGLLTHEAPRLTDTGSPPYPATHRDRDLVAGMVLSIETHVADPALGFVKLEDTLIVTEDGGEPVGDAGRGWNPLGR